MVFGLLCIMRCDRVAVIVEAHRQGVWHDWQRGGRIEPARREAGAEPGVEVVRRRLADLALVQVDRDGDRRLAAGLQAETVECLRISLPLALPLLMRTATG